jgi:hypothetical protein
VIGSVTRADLERAIRHLTRRLDGVDPLLPICHARCCTLTFALSTADLDEASSRRAAAPRTLIARACAAPMTAAPTSGSGTSASSRRLRSSTTMAAPAVACAGAAQREALARSFADED